MKALSSIKNRRTNPQPPTGGSGVPPPPPQSTRNPVSAQNPNIPPNGNGTPQQALTLPQVIQLLDVRIINLEKFVKDVKLDPATVLGLTVVPSPTEETPKQGHSVSFQSDIDNNTQQYSPYIPPTEDLNSQSQSQTQTQKDLTEETQQYVNEKELGRIYDEFDKRYEMLAEEIIHMKNIVLNLQSYTMDVNKLLMEERMSLIKDTMEKDEDEYTNMSNLPEDFAVEEA